MHGISAIFSSILVVCPSVLLDKEFEREAVVMLHPLSSKDVLVFTSIGL